MFEIEKKHNKQLFTQFLISKTMLINEILIGNPTKIIEIQIH
jgi:hypothetical protein